MATVNSHVVELSWDTGMVNSSLELLGYDVYRNDTLLNCSIVKEQGFIDTDVPAGNHYYKVFSVFIGKGNGPYAAADVVVSNVRELNASGFSLFPNPTTGLINLHIPGMQSVDNKIEIYNPQGQKVFEKKTGKHASGTYQVNLRLSPGVYFLRFKSPTARFAEQIVIL